METESLLYNRFHITITRDPRGLFIQLGGWFAYDSWLGYVRVGHRRRWLRSANV